MAGTIAARMDRLPITRRHRLATVAIGLGLFFDLYEIFLAGVLGSVLEKHFHLSKSALALLLASAFLGMFAGAVLFGRIADRLGRRRAFLLSLGTYSLFSLLGAFSTGPAMLVVTRFLAGLGIGAEPPVSDTYLGDLLPPKHRGRYTAWAYTIAFLGVPAAGFLGRWLTPAAPLGFEGWRWLLVLGALGSVIVFALRTGLPESPRWLEAVGRKREAEEVVARFERDAGELPEPTENPVAPTESGRLRELFVPPYRRRTGMMAVFHVLQTIGYYGFGTLAPIVLVAKGFPVVQSLLFTALTYLGYPVGSALSLPVVERVERKFLVLGSAVLMAVFGVAFGLATAAWLIVVCGFLYTTASNLFSNAFHIYQAEIFPTALRGTATSGTYALSRLASGVMPFVLLPLLHSAGAGVLFTVVALAMVLVVVDVALFGPRTTGRVLEAVNSRVAPGADQQAQEAR
ncbi:MFS transporter, putative metabolite:H+ symporter [Amycolatopsis sacchari]|uniref:MFS transporter, putative metabolite:H+ symporter n=1 Tax=Amycolatopsis sacchari TaxID=115433 RepID=A0A1I3PTK9_9PSEU|nr:MFS transporter [Amycolatopsis sacchari]SFJ24893.1 MFS transporter, putative metabolite:H+ symporter [Amycolatopsis sacchari]